MKYYMLPIVPFLCGLLLASQAFGQGIPSRFFKKGETLDQKINAVLPKDAEEPWKHIHLYTNLMQARAESQQSGKPIFLIVNTGNPLCAT